MTLKEQIEAYVPYNEQEEQDKSLILSVMEEDGIYTRENTRHHLTSSCWIVNKDMTKVLMCYHNIYKSYSWLGGHLDGDHDALHVALKEANEESGLKNITPYSEKIFSLESLTVDGHIKRGVYVSSHLHLNVTYLMIADENEPLRVKEDENSDLKWFDIDDVMNHVTEPWMNERVYSKLISKVRELKKSI